jgi:hypothetical protein
MNHAYTNSPHRVFIIDLEPQLSSLQMIIADYCDEYDLVNELSLLLTTISFLYVRDSVSESTEAMEIHVNSFCRYEHTPFNTLRLHSAIHCYMREVHDLFVEAGLYGNGPYLKYAFGGWHDLFTAIFVPLTNIQEYPQARSSFVYSEPASRNPLHTFPLHNDPDAANRVYNFSLRGEEIIPF